MISLRDVTFTYPEADRPVFQSVNLEVMPGDFVLVLGPSGSGKSTLLRCLNGLVPHFSGGTLRGTIRVAGYDPVLVSPQVMSQHVGFVFQDPEAQFVVDRVEDEVAFALENLALSPEEIGYRLDATLDLVGLTALRQRRLDSLSGGEKQRVALAAVLALQPSLLVLDEPTSQLDPGAAHEVLETLVRLNRDLGLTILLAEHRLERVLPFVNRVIYMPGENGEILAGEPREVLAQVDLVSPVIAVGKFFNWQPLPLTVQEAKPYTDRAQFTLLSTSVTSDKEPDERNIALQVEDLYIYYDSHPAVKGVDLKVRSGEILALIGPNGAGKTTLLRSLVGLIKVASGRISLFGGSILAKEPVELTRQIGYLPQDPNTLLFADRVIDELLFTLRNRELHRHKLDRDKYKTWEMDANERAVKFLNHMRMADLATAYPRDLSTGQRQRVALAAIMVAEPQILLLDEPTRGLDSGSKKQLADLLCKWRDAGRTIILVTHDMELAARLADRVALMQSGQVIAVGSPLEMFLAFPEFTPQILQLFPQAGSLTPEDIFSRIIPDKTSQCS